MAGCLSKYTPDQYDIVLNQILYDLDNGGNGEILRNYLQNTYEQEDADKLYDAIMVSRDFTPDFTIEAAADPAEPKLNEDNIDWDTNNDLSVLSNFNREDTGGRVAYDKMISDFRKTLISALIYNIDTNTRINLNADTESGYSVVEEAMYNFKQDLLHTIWDFTGQSHEENYEDHIQFTKQIHRTLKDFEIARAKKISTIKSEDYIVNGKNAYIAYVMLSNFNKIINDNCGDIVKIKEAYSGTKYHYIEMYEYFGPRAVQDYSPSTNEDADVSKYSSDLVKILCDYIPEVHNGNNSTISIGFTGFCRVISLVKLYAELNPTSKAHKALFARTRNSNGDLVRSSEVDWYTAIEDYLNTINSNSNSEYFTTLKDKLSGIQKYIFTKLDNGRSVLGIPIEYRHVFAAQADRTVQAKYIVYRNDDEVPNANDKNKMERPLKSKDLMDGFVLNQSYFLQDSIKQVGERYQAHPEEFIGASDNPGFLTSHNISYDGNNRTFILNDSRGNTSTIKINGVKNHVEVSVSGNLIDDTYLISVIQDFLHIIIPDDYTNILQSIGQSTLIDTFGKVLGYAFDVATDTKQERYTYQKKKIPDIHYYTRNIDQAARFLGLVYGEETMNTIHNAEGNNLPLYQLGALVNDLRFVIEDLTRGAGIKSTLTGKNKSSIFDSNVIVKNEQALGNIWIRSDVQSKDGKKVKQAKNLNVAEVSYLSILKDFYDQIMVGDGEVRIQPITFADKARHFLFSIKTKLVRVIAKTNAAKIFKNLQSILQTIGASFKNDADGNTIAGLRNDAVTAAYDTIVDSRRGRTRKQVINLLARFNTVLNPEWSTLNQTDRNTKIENLYNLTDSELISEFRKLQKTLNDNDYSLKDLKKKFKEKHVDFFIEADYDLNRFGKCDVNAMICQDVEFYLNPDSDAFKRHIKKEQFNFVNDLTQAGFRLNGNLDYGLKSIIDKWQSGYTDIMQKWYDPMSGIMKLARIYKDGKEVFPTATDWAVICDPKNSIDYDIELNPILETYYYGDILLSTDLDVLLFGTTSSYQAKFRKSDLVKNGAPTYTTDEDYWAASEAQRFVTETKRTVPAGATRYRFYTGMHFGIDDTFKIAVMSDIKAPLWNMTGHTDNDKTTDGCGWASPEESILENWSLLDAAVGDDKKTIFLGHDPETGAVMELKWAVYKLSNARRKSSPVSSTMKLEEMYRKMHSFDLGNVNFKLQDYYDPTGNHISNSKWEDNRQLTTTQYIYKYDNESGKYYRLNSITSNPFENTYTAVWQQTDSHGNIVTTSTETITRKIHNLYDIDQAFGGAYTMKYDEDAEMLVDSDENNYICARLVCEENLKDKFLAYVVNHSAIKVGAHNVNDSNIFEPDHQDEELQYFEMASRYGGVQMDASHEVEGGDITEMSQLISALIQNGYSAKIVNNIYEDIGKVTKQAIDKLVVASKEESETGNNDAVYRILGEALIKSFSTGQKNTLGLAQAFVSLAESKLEETKYKLPFSAATVKPMFISSITSMLNTKSIKRKYPGLAGVQSPSYGTIQFFAIEGDEHKDYMNFKEVRDYIRRNTTFMTLCNDPTIQKDPNNIAKWSVYNNDYDPEQPISEFNQKYKESNIHRAFFDQMLDSEGNIRNPFIKKIETLRGQKLLDIEDTIVVRRKGDKGYGQVVVLDSLSKFDFYRNCISRNDYEIYRWTIKPRDLKQSETWIEIKDGLNTRIINAYDLDSLRAVFYLQELIDPNFVDSLSEEAKNRYLEAIPIKENLLNKVLKDKILSSADSNGNEILYNWKQIIQLAVSDSDLAKRAKEEIESWVYDLNAQTQDLMESLDTVAEGNTISFPYQESMNDAFNINSKTTEEHIKQLEAIVLPGTGTGEINRGYRYYTNLKRNLPDTDFSELEPLFKDLNDTVIASRVTFRPAQIIAGRVFGDIFKLHYGDSIHAIKSKGVNFFKERLSNMFVLPNASVPTSDYEGVAYTADGKELLIAYATSDSNLDTLERKNFHTLTNSKRFHLIDDTYYYNSTELCPSEGVVFKSYIDDSGAEHDIAIIQNTESATELLRSGIFAQIRWNYTIANLKNLLKIKYENDIDASGNIIEGKEIYIRGVRTPITNFDEITAENAIEYVNALNKSEEYRIKRFNDNLSKHQYEAFLKSLEFIATRIPAQSMQSFTLAEIVNFIETSANEVYLPRVIAWLEGSDYDIDKWYAMGYSFLRNGTYAEISNIREEFGATAEDLTKLPTPRGVKFSTTANKYHLKVDEIYQNRGRIDINADKINGNYIISVKINITDPFINALTYQEINGLTLEEGQSFILDSFNYDLEDKTFDWHGYVIDSEGNIIHTPMDFNFETKESIDPDFTNSIVNIERISENNIVSIDELNAIIDDDLNCNFTELSTLLTKLYDGLDSGNINKIIFDRGSNNNSDQNLAEYILGVRPLNSDKQRKLLDVINEYSGTRMTNARMLSSLRNLVKSQMHIVLSNPSSQINLHTEISFGDAKKAAKQSSVGKRETFLNLDCPTAKFIMQEQNMIGKDVIGIAAVSLKGFFASTDFYNGEVTDLIDKVRSLATVNDTQKIFDDIFTTIKNITFDVKFGNEHIGSLANIYWKPIIKLLETEEYSKYKIIKLTNTNYNTDLQGHLSTYIDKTTSTFNLYECIKALNHFGNYKINAADAISALLSAATDNAKELILGKINATSKFADVYTFLLSIGVPFMNIANFMISPIFNIVSNFTNDNILDPNTNFFNLENSLAFVRDQKSLGTLNNDIYHWFVERWIPIENLESMFYSYGNQGSLIANLLFETDDSGTLKHSAEELPIIKAESPFFRLVKEFYQLNDENAKVNVSNRDAVMGVFGVYGLYKNNKARFITALNHLLNGYLYDFKTGSLSSISNEEFKDVINSVRKSSIYAYELSKTSAHGVYSKTMNEEDIPDYVYDGMDNGSVVNANKTRDEIRNNKLSQQNARNLYTYVQTYLIPKYELMRALGDKNYVTGLQNLEKLSNFVLPGAEELTILGNFLSVNKGLNTKDFEEYKWIANLEKFINGRYIKSTTKMLPFSFTQFMNDKEYRDLQIKQYNSVKTALPILEIVSKVPHFREMLSVAAMNRELIQHSTAVKLERILARKILTQQQTNSKGSEINKGYGNMLNEAEFKKLSNYVNSVLIHNWLIHQGTENQVLDPETQKEISYEVNGLTISVPDGFKLYSPNGRFNRRVLSARKRIAINSELNAANFRLIVEEFILSKLQQSQVYKNNRFISQLSVGSAIDKTTGAVVNYLRSTIPMSRVDCQKLQLLFDDILADFNKIARDPLSKVSELSEYKNWTVGDIFYLYNLLVYKDGYNKDALTRLFEDYAKRAGDESVVGSFYNYLSSLDHGDINIFKTRIAKSLNGINLIEDDIVEKLPSGNIGFEYSLNDALLFVATNAASSYKLKAEAKINKATDEFKFYLYNSDNSIRNITTSTISDAFLSDFPLRLYSQANKMYDSKNILGSTKELGIPTVSTQYVTMSAAVEDVYKAIVDKVNELTGNKISIKTFNPDVLGDHFTEPFVMEEFGIPVNDEVEWERYKNANGFIYNGDVYLSMQEPTAREIPIHELMHVICATMKFSPNKKIRDFYYELLRSDVSSNPIMDEGLLNDYKKMLNDETLQYFYAPKSENRSIKTTDFKEEVLVRLLSDKLATQLDENIYKDENNQIKRNEIKQRIFNIIESIFNTGEDSFDYDIVESISLDQLVKVFSNNLINKEGGELTKNNVILNQGLKTIKDQLIKTGKIKISEGC